MADIKKIGLFAGGVLFGSAGIKALSSKDAKKVYTQGTAAVLRVKDCLMKTATNVQENAEDILAEAKQINKDREESEAEEVLEAECNSKRLWQKNRIEAFKYEVHN